MRVRLAELHPSTGCRYVFQRLQREPLEYAVDAFVSGGRTIRGRLRWANATKAQFEITEERPGASDAEPETAPSRDAVIDQIHKLARVVRQTEQPTLSRWRG